MNRCPSCRNLVPAGWIACRRCGAALTSSRPLLTVAHGATATLVRPVVLQLPVGHDNLLPRAATDNLLPRSDRRWDWRSHVRRHWRPQRIHVVTFVSVLAVAASAWTASRVVLSGDSPPAAQHADVTRTERLLRVATDTARLVYIQRGTYASLPPAALAVHLRGVSVVAAGIVARSNQVSIRPQSAKLLVLASPADEDTCLFRRDDPANARVESAVTHGVPCNAANAPRTGWSS
jgi:hypothetical protein